MVALRRVYHTQKLARKSKFTHKQRQSFSQSFCPCERKGFTPIVFHVAENNRQLGERTC